MRGLQPLAGAAHAFDDAQTLDVQRDTVHMVNADLTRPISNQETGLMDKEAAKQG
jgi:hypothetical protein